MDEVSATSANEAFYKSIATYVKSLSSSYLVVLNPGTIPSTRCQL
jgi:hypothetical protein